MPLPILKARLLNSACPWATTEADLQALFDSHASGAVTTRTCMLDGFQHDDSIHQHAFFDHSHNSVSMSALKLGDMSLRRWSLVGDLLQTYQHIRLQSIHTQYLDMIRRLVARSKNTKLIIISVTGTPVEIVECYRQINTLQGLCELAMEINLSCPNIPDKPPPAYSGDTLTQYLARLSAIKTDVSIGIKTPPYTYHGQFQMLISALKRSNPCPVDFITTTNTLGSSLMLNSSGLAAINSATGTGIGGMAGAALHPLSLGNVKTIRTMLDENGLESIDIIGVGGVSDYAGYKRMLSAGARYVAIATALGARGIEVFEDIHSSVKGESHAHGLANAGV